jgi:hypothetical protein
MNNAFTALTAALVFAVTLLPARSSAADPAPDAGAPKAAAAAADAGAPKAGADAGVVEVPAQSPCHQDLEAFCDGIAPGQGDQLRCLVGKQDQLSNACKAKLQQLKKDLLAGSDACDGDVDAFCATVPKTGGRIVQCLLGHKKDLSKTCSELFTKLGVTK